MTRCCPADVIVFGHVQCGLRPAWAADVETAEAHDADDWIQREMWLRQAGEELRRSRVRSAVAAWNMGRGAATGAA